MLREYALIPDIFDPTQYSSPQVCDVHLQNLKTVLLEEALVRDLRDGGWSAWFKLNLDRWSPHAKELQKKLVNQNRLRLVPSASVHSPLSDIEWCGEALDSHQASALDGIVGTGASIASLSRPDSIVTNIEGLHNAAWWQSRSCSVRLKRASEEYRRCLRLVLSQANSLMFIDPHLNPMRHGYEDFFRLVKDSHRDALPPAIEVHRVCYRGSGKQREIVKCEEWRHIFRDGLGSKLASAGASVEIFIWDDFHDRYLISDIIGISLANGFDNAIGGDQRTTWTRLSRKDRDDVQREFDRSCSPHRLHDRFSVP